MMKMRSCVVLSILVTLLTVSVHGAPTTYGFGAITSNSTIDPYIGQSQLSLIVDSYGADQVLFTFSNAGPAASSITDIYIEDGILGFSEIQNSSGVLFSQGANPHNLPSGNTIGFNADKSLSADSDSPTQSNGVNPGEKLGIVFNILDDYTYDDIINRMNLGLGRTSDIAGDLRVGIHVQGFADGQSESFVLRTPPPSPPTVPVPSALVLAGIGLSCLLKTRKQWC